MNAEEVLAQAGVPKWFATLAYHGSADLPGQHHRLYHSVEIVGIVEEVVVDVRHGPWITA